MPKKRRDVLDSLSYPLCLCNAKGRENPRPFDIFDLKITS